MRKLIATLALVAIASGAVVAIGHADKDGGHRSSTLFDFGRSFGRELGRVFGIEYGGDSATPPAPSVSAGTDSSAPIAGSPYNLNASCSGYTSCEWTDDAVGTVVYTGGATCSCDDTSCDKEVENDTEEIVTHTLTCDASGSDDVALDWNDNDPTVNAGTDPGDAEEDVAFQVDDVVITDPDVLTGCTWSESDADGICTFSASGACANQAACRLTDHTCDTPSVTMTLTITCDGVADTVDVAIGAAGSATVSAYYPQLDYQDLYDEIVATKSTEAADAIFYDGVNAADHEAAAPACTNDVNCTTAAECQTALGTAGNRAIVTSDFTDDIDFGTGAVSVPAANTCLDINGHKTGGVLTKSATTLTGPFRVQDSAGGGTMGSFLSSGAFTACADVSFVGVAISGDLAPSSGPGIHIIKCDRVTIADTVIRGRNVGAANGGSTALLTDVLQPHILNSALGAYLSSTGDSWATRFGAATRTTQGAIVVDSYLRGGTTSTTLRHAYLDGEAVWTTSDERATSYRTTIINLVQRSPWRTVGITATPPVDVDHVWGRYFTVQFGVTGGVQFGAADWASSGDDAEWWVGDYTLYYDADPPFNQTNLNALEATADANGCDCEYGTPTFTGPTSTAISPPATRDSYLMGTSSLEGDPYSLPTSF